MLDRNAPRRHLLALAAAAGVLAIGACDSAADDEANGDTTEVSSETLAEEVADADELSAVSEVLRDAGLAQVFDGTAAYTIFAPQDAALDKLGEAGKALRSPEDRPAMVAILRDHIVPGYLTPDDIAKAIEMDEDGTVEMRTMADHVLKFTREGETVTVTAEDGASARFAGDALRASNGVAIPIDGVLRNIGEPGPAGGA